MFSKPIKAALILVIVAGLSLVFMATGALAHNPTTQPPGVAGLNATAGIVYSQPPSSDGMLFLSSQWAPNGSNSDQFVWENFTLASTQTITETDWMGGYSPSGGSVFDFGVAFYPSIAGGSQPDINNPLVQYQTGGNAGETFAGTLGGVDLYQYKFGLPVPFQAIAGTTYWVKIYAYENNSPTWGLKKGTGGDNSHFLEYYSDPSWRYRLIPGDVAFTLLGPLVPISNLSAINDSPTPLGNVTSLTATIATGSNINYQWNFGNGAIGYGKEVTYTYATVGFYTALVTASNSVSVVTATTPITIFGALPLANPGPNQSVTTGAEVTLDGSGSFALPGHRPLTYFWQQLGGTPVVLNSYTISRPTFSSPTAPTILTFTLVVTDAMNLASDPAQVQIDVRFKYSIYLPLLER